MILKIQALQVIACVTSCNANYSGSTHARVQIDGLIYNKTHFRAIYAWTHKFQSSGSTVYSLYYDNVPIIKNQ